MYKMRKNYGLTPATFSGMLDTMLTNNWDRMFSDDHQNYMNVPVNIKETDAAFEMDLVAPGLKKEDFNINIEKDVLTVSFEHKEEKKETTDKVIRNEYKFRSFKRSFTLSDKINAEGISAKYTDGILSLNLPKAEPKADTTKKIEIA